MRGDFGAGGDGDIWRPGLRGRASDLRFDAPHWRGWRLGLPK